MSEKNSIADVIAAIASNVNKNNDSSTPLVFMLHISNATDSKKKVHAHIIYNTVFFWE